MLNDNLAEKNEHIIDVDIEEVMKESFLDYSMSVIVSRALPDVRDGLKPVQRRILYAMNELGLLPNKPYKKSARIVGEVLGKYHPHGDSAIYDALVRMAQDFSYREPLIDGHGNFGSIDGDGAAAMRYTEARLSKIAVEMLRDIEKDTVDFVPNFDNEEKEPVVLPTVFPNLLVNGTTGIAVGMATNIPPHNIGEVVDGLIAYIENKEITIEELADIIKGPDFPTGACILGKKEILNYFRTGNGKVRVRAKTHVEELKGGKQAIIIDEIPYMTNKAKIIEEISRLIADKKIDGISELRDESDKQGMRIYIELKKGYYPQVVESQLFKYTNLETTFGANIIALVNGVPKLLNLKQLLEEFLEFRVEVVVRRTKYDLRKAEERAHILEGLRIALANIDEVVAIIKGSKDTGEAKRKLMESFVLTEVQATAILDMRLARLTSLEIEKIEQEYNELIQKIKEYKEILASRSMQEEIIKNELLEIKEKYNNPRRTEILEDSDDFYIGIEDMIHNDDMIILVTNNGYIKRVPVEEYKVQRRGGKGINTSYKSDDEYYIKNVYYAKMLSYLLLFTNKGKCYWKKVYELPEGSKNSRGRPLISLLEIDKDEDVLAILPVEEFVENKYIVTITKNGIINKISLMDFSRPRRTGILAVNVAENDELLDTILVEEGDEIFIATKEGKAIRFEEENVTKHGRNTRGVRGITLAPGDEVVGIVNIHKDMIEEASILTITEKGYGKLTKLSEYRKTNRGGKGVLNIKITKKNGKVVSVSLAKPDDEVFVVTEKGKIIRTKLTLRELRRVSIGVKIINVEEDDVVNGVLVNYEDEE